MDINGITLEIRIRPIACIALKDSEHLDSRAWDI